MKQLVLGAWVEGRGRLIEDDERCVEAECPGHSMIRCRCPQAEVAAALEPLREVGVLARWQRREERVGAGMMRGLPDAVEILDPLGPSPMSSRASNG